MPKGFVMDILVNIRTTSTIHKQ